MSGQLHAPAAVSQGEEPQGTHLIGSWMVPRIGVDVWRRAVFVTPAENWTTNCRSCGHHINCAMLVCSVSVAVT